MSRSSPASAPRCSHTRPPIRSRASSTATSRPRASRSRAATRPARPAPMTMHVEHAPRKYPGPGRAVASIACTRRPHGPRISSAGCCRRSSHAFTTELTAALEDVGVSPRAHCVLVAALQGEHTQSELAQAIGLDKTTMVVTIDALEAPGSPSAGRRATDRRARVIARHRRRAAQVVAEGERIVARIQDDVLAALPARAARGVHGRAAAARRRPARHAGRVRAPVRRKRSVVAA